MLRLGGSMRSLSAHKEGTSPVLFSSPVSVSVIARIRDTLDLLVYNSVLAVRVLEERIFSFLITDTDECTVLYQMI